MYQSLHPPRRMYVAHNGSDSNSGVTPDDPVATIKAALGRLPWGGSVLVHSTESDPVQETSSTVFTSDRDVAILPYGVPMFYVAGHPGVGYVLAAAGTGVLTIKQGHFTGTATSGVRCGSTGGAVGTGKLVAVDCYAEAPQSGWQSAGQFEYMTLTRCQGLGVANDGFNVHGDTGVEGVVTLVDCIGNDCGDEGVSPHVDTVLNIIGGEFRRNGQSGMAAVDRAVCNISGGAVFAENGTAYDGSNPYGGVTYLGESSGTINGALMTDNNGRGVWLNTSGSVTLSSYTSTGNAFPDLI